MSEASYVPFMPEVVSKYFGDIVKFTASKVHSDWGHVFEFQELEQEAWGIALRRWQMWSDQKAAARKDLTIHLRRWVDDQLAARGWKRVKQEDGTRRWVPAIRVQTYDPQSWSMDGYSSPWAIEAEDEAEDRGLSLASGWAPMGYKKRERFARILMHRYPRLVAEFEAVAEQVKPRNLSRVEHERRQGRARARLRVTWAVQLAEARYAVEGFELESAA